MEATDLITFSQAAKEAGISRPTLRKRMGAGTSPPFRRVGREVVFVLGEVLDWARENYPADRPRKGRAGP